MSLVANYPFGDGEQRALSMLPCQPTRVTNALLRRLHPSGFRDLRAIRKGEAPLTFGAAADDLQEVDLFVKFYGAERNLYVGVAILNEVCEYFAFDEEEVR